MPTLSWPEPLPRSGPIRLRPFRPSDLHLVAELSCDPYVPLLGSVPASFTEAEGLAYLDRQHQRLAEGTGWSFAIAELGTTGLSAMRVCGGTKRPSHGRVRGGVGLPRPRVRQSSAPGAYSFAWTQSDIDRIDLFIEQTNPASIADARSCGYRQEELVLRHLKVDGALRYMVR